MVSIVYLAVGDRWELFGAVGTLFPAKFAVLVQWVSICYQSTKRNNNFFRIEKVHICKKTSWIRMMKVIDSNQFWKKTVDVLKIHELLVKMLKMCDGYYLNTQFLYGINSSNGVLSETMTGDHNQDIDETGDALDAPRHSFWWLLS
ncbi:hypothetical protein GQ457_08G033760 [Hibiscus cannabinus]